MCWAVCACTTSGWPDCVHPLVCAVCAGCAGCAVCAVCAGCTVSYTECIAQDMDVYCLFSSFLNALITRTLCRTSMPMLEV